MCGIFGCVGKMDREKAVQCIKTISYRGPNDLSVQQTDGLTFAHARLAILDTSDKANQPMVDRTGRYWLVFNGEIYNYIELRNVLLEKGYCFDTKSDTEVVLYGYIEWGEKLQEKCNGMWAFAIWDNLKKKLFLSRDRFGIKPLYFYRDHQNFYFGSEMKAFFPIMKEKRINTEIFETKDYFSYETTDSCCIKGIYKIPAGCSGVFEKNRLSVNRWWCTLDHLVDVPGVYSEQVEYFRELFQDACRLRMRSDVPIGTALSGGVDSSAVVGFMKEISLHEDGYANRDWQHAFVASMPDTTLDETKYAEVAAGHVGMKVNKVNVSSKISPEEILRYMYICEDPYITSPIPFLQTYRSVSESGVRVTLDGHGADELFGGYPDDLYIAGKNCRDNEEKLKELWDTYNTIQMPERKIDFNRFMALVDWQLVGKSKEENHEKWPALDYFNQRLYIQTHEKILPTLLRCYDRYSMGNGVEIRMPFMDYRIVSFAFSIPWTSKLRNGYTKSIVRDMAAPYMDDTILYRKDKVGFNSPLTEWFQGDLKEFLLDMVHSRDFSECELINPLDVAIKVHEFFNSKHADYSAGASLWRDIMPYLWKKSVIDGQWDRW